MNETATRAACLDWTSEKMRQKEQIIEFAKAVFDPLVENHGFMPPTVTVDRATTQIDFLSREVGIEIEFDWRDFEAFVLVVRLEAGRLPNGYYVSRGRTCRKHLHEVFRERGWTSPHAPSVSDEKPSETKMRAALLAQKEALLPHVEDLLRLGESVF